MRGAGSRERGLAQSVPRFGTATDAVVERKPDGSSSRFALEQSTSRVSDTEPGRDGTALEVISGVSIESMHRPAPGVLLVDDEVNILKSLARLLGRESVRIFTAANADEARAVLEREAVQLVLSDQRIPGMSGVTLLSEIRERWPEVIRILLTGYTEMGVAVDAINRCEVFRLLTKPWDDEELLATVRQALDIYFMRGEITRLNEITQEQNRTLERKVEERTHEVREKNLELRKAYVSTVRALAEAVDAKDAYTRGHSERVGVYASRIAQELGCKNQFIERIYLAGLLHDIGKIGIPDAIICKPLR